MVARPTLKVILYALTERLGMRTAHFAGIHCDSNVGGQAIFCDRAANAADRRCGCGVAIKDSGRRRVLAKIGGSNVRKAMPGL
jgi:hypothetical protein